MTHASTQSQADTSVGFGLKHRRYVDFSHAHYSGNLVDGAYVLGMFGDVATDLCLHMDGDEGLFASYSGVTFHAPVQAGDVLEVSATVSRVGNRSRTVSFQAHVLARSSPQDGPSAGRVLTSPLLVVSAIGTVVVPAVAAGREPAL
ncbi:hotdog domain-containing protein [Sphaerisporangium sp. NPDC051011]|uniref:3-aminobutyryl-CoA ammonia lyase n=1 Tax=Sphaerisporangium sp. NPDC051011 TaxID=3155792 RepID=UPI0033C96F5C